MEEDSFSRSRGTMKGAKRGVQDTAPSSEPAKSSRVRPCMFSGILLNVMGK